MPLIGQALHSVRKKKGSKMKNVRIRVDGMTFDSKKEFRRWNELKSMRDAGLISDLERQVAIFLTGEDGEPLDGEGEKEEVRRGFRLQRCERRSRHRGCEGDPDGAVSAEEGDTPRDGPEHKGDMMEGVAWLRLGEELDKDLGFDERWHPIDGQLQRGLAGPMTRRGREVVYGHLMGMMITWLRCY